MPYTIYAVDGKVNYDVIPVAVLKNFPQEKRDYKPFTQCKICLSPMGLSVRLMTFEAIPDEKSCMRAVFCPENIPVSVDVCQNQTYTLKLGSEKADLPDFKTHFFKGEDLQGKYWGADFVLTEDIMKKVSPNFTFKGLTSLKGNIFKICEEGKRPHFGSYFPSDTGEFEVEKY